MEHKAEIWTTKACIISSTEFNLLAFQYIFTYVTEDAEAEQMVGIASFFSLHLQPFFKALKLRVLCAEHVMCSWREVVLA